MSRTSRHLLLGTFAVAAIPAFLLLDTAIARLRGWQPPTRDAALMLPVSGALVVVALFLALSGPGRRFLEVRWAQMLFLLASTVFFWLGGETLLWAIKPDLRWFHRNVPNETRVRIPNPEWMPGITGKSRHTVNSLGVRGPEFPPRDEAYRILCIGGSTTANLYLDDEETWTYLIGELLNERLPGRVWTGSVGMSGYASWQHLAFLQSSRLVDEVDMVLVLVGANDLARGMMGAPIANNLQAAPLWTHSNIYNGMRIALKILLYRNIDTEETATGSKYPIRRAKRRAAQLTNEMPDLSEAIAEYKSNLREIVETARSRGVRPVLASQPMLWREGLSPQATELLWLGMVKGDRYLTPGKLRVAMDLFNAALFEVCAETGAQCIDLSALSGDERLFFDDAHFTELGSAEVARIIAAHLASRPELFTR